MSRIAEAMNPGPYGVLPGYKEPTTSREAAVKFKAFAGNLQAEVLTAILAATDGLTADEVATKLNQSVLAVRPRVSELRVMEKIEASGVRRKNASGMSAKVWVGRKAT